MSAKLSLGPLIFNWPAEEKRDFYFRMADESAVDTVYVGEVVCSKREPFFAPYLPAVVERLQGAGKEVVLSSLALIMTEREQDAARQLCQNDDIQIEANDVATASLLMGKSHCIGPYVNVYNEDTVAYLVANGARRICLPAELPGDAVAAIAALDFTEIELQAFGRLPLALSARCYHARAHNLSKDGCQYVCEQDPDGMEVETLDRRPFLAVNGTQTISHSYVSLAREVRGLAKDGVGMFRLSPHSADMVAVADVFRNLLDGHLDEEESGLELDKLIDGEPMANGFIHGLEGWVQTDKAGVSNLG